MIIRKKKRRKRHNLKKWIIVLVTLIVAVIVVSGGFVFYNLHNAAQTSYKPALNHHLRNPQSAIASHKPLSILLLGKNAGTSNVAMVSTINGKLGITTLTDLPDKYASIDSVGDMSQKVQNEMHVPVDNYIQTDINGLMNVIDKVDGISINGKNMSGEEAGLYLQSANGYHDRQNREQQILFALLHRATQANNIMRPKVVNAFSKNVKTDLSFSDLEQLATHYHGADNNRKSIDMQNTGKNQKQKAAKFIKRNLDE